MAPTVVVSLMLMLGACGRGPSAKVATTQWLIEGLSADVQRFRQERGVLPRGLWSPGGKDPSCLERTEATLDTWAGPIVYTVIGGSRFELMSLGADGVRGGEGEDADIVFEFE